jgi:hypothetical protein
MPNRTAPTRRASTSPSRFSRPGTAPRSGTGGRFSRTTPSQRPSMRGRKKQKSSGVSGLLSSAMSALPIGGAKKSKGRGRKSSSAGGSKAAKPAMALAAAAGAMLGRRRMQKRKHDDAMTPPVTPT